jgi:hypothetical protein
MLPVSRTTPFGEPVVPEVKRLVFEDHTKEQTSREITNSSMGEPKRKG